VKRALALAVACSACAIGPHLVSAPMLSSVPVAKASVDAGADDAPPEEPDAPRVVLAGTWSGRAWQTGNQSYPLTVTFAPRGAEVVGLVHYPERHCRTEWRLREGRPRHWSGPEIVRIDPINQCPRQGRVSVEWIDSSTLQWNWSGPSGAASAKLERSQP
jgi:hypothetical protein